MTAVASVAAGMASTEASRHLAAQSVLSSIQSGVRRQVATSNTAGIGSTDHHQEILAACIKRTQNTSTPAENAVPTRASTGLRKNIEHAWPAAYASSTQQTAPPA